MFLRIDAGVSPPARRLQKAAVNEHSYRVITMSKNHRARSHKSGTQTKAASAFKPALTQLEDRSVPAAAGALDLAFGGTGLVQTDFQAGTDEAHAIAVDALGRYVVVGFTSPGTETEDGPPADAGGGGGGGEESAPNPLTDFAVARYNADGTLDATFGTGGKVVVNVSQLAYGTTEEDKAYGIAIDASGRIVVSGYVNHGTVTLPTGTLIDHDFAVVRLNANGTLDTTFGGDGVVVTDFGLVQSDEALDIEVQADGKIVAAGRSGTSNSEGTGATADFALARYNADGSLDATFGTGGLVTTDIAGGTKDEGKRIALMGDGRIVMVGMTESSSGPDFALARYNLDGSLDTGFAGDGTVVTDFGATDEGQDIAVQADGKVVAVGHVGTLANFGLARYNLDGSLDTTFGAGGKVETDFGGRPDFPFAVGVQQDGRIVAAGRAVPSSGGAFQYAVARYNTNGSLDTAFGGGGTVLTDFGSPPPDQGYAVAVQANRIVVAGVANSDFGLAAYAVGQGGSGGGGSGEGGATPRGPQFTVSAVTGSESGPPVVAIVNAAGDFVAAWESLGTDGSGVGVYAQAFKADGTAIGTPALVNTTTLGNQSRPTIASDGTGNFVIAWQSESATGGAYDIYYTSGAYNGATQSFSLTPGEIRVNEVITGKQLNPTAAMDSFGRFVIAWQSDQNVTLGTTGIDVFARYGTVAGGLIATAGIDDVTIAAGAGDEVNPDAAMAATGGSDSGRLLVTWTGVGTASAEEEATIVIDGALFNYNADFSIFGNTFTGQLTSTAPEFAQHDQVNPDVAMNAAGRTVLVWQAEGGQGTGSDVFSRRIDTSDTGLTFVDTGNVPVNTVVREPQRNPVVGIAATGDYFVTWQSQGVDSRSWGIVGRAFDAAGNNLRTDFVVNVNEQGPQTNPAVAVAPSGRVVAAWAGPFVPTHGGQGGAGEEGVEGEGGHQPAVFARLFNATGTVDVVPAATATNVNGLEFQLAAVGAGEDVPASATLLSDGTYVIVWQGFEETEDPSGYGVYGQRVGADGTPIGTKFLVNQTTLGYQSNPSVAALANGGFVVVWQGEVRDPAGVLAPQFDVFGRLFSTDADPATADTPLPVGAGEFVINANTTTGFQGAPSVASNGTDDFVVVWQTDAQTAAELGYEVYGRRYSAGGATATPLAPEFRVNTVPFVTVTPEGGSPTDTGENQVSPKIAMNAAGQFAVVWVSDHNVANDAADTEKSVFVRWFGANVFDQATAATAAPEFLANTYTQDAQEHPAVGIDAAGDIVVAWQSINQEVGGQGVSWGVFARQFHPDGSSPQDEEFQVNTTVLQPQRFPGVGVDAAGRFTIAWQSINQDGSSWGVFQRQYRADGTPETGEQQVNTVTQGPQIQPVFARAASGGYGLFWSGGMAEHVDGIGGRLYGINAVPSAPILVGPGGLSSGGVTGNERSTIPLSLSLSPADADVFETLSVVITGVPADATLSAGTKMPDGSWVLTPAQLAGLTIRAAHDGTFTLTVTGIATELKTNQQASTTQTITVNVQNVDFMVAGTGSGAAVVAQYALDGTLMRLLNPFPSFTGGVTVATGDVNGDGVPDVIVGMATVAPIVVVYDGATGGILNVFWAFPMYGGGVNVAAGDVDGDGRAEIIVGTTSFVPAIAVFDAMTGALRSATLLPGVGGVHVAAGDTDGDGRAEVIAGLTAAPVVGVLDGITGALRSAFLAFPMGWGGATVAAGDIDGDGKAEIFTGTTGGVPVIGAYRPDGSLVGFAMPFGPFAASVGARVGAGDADGDGRAEVMVGTGPGTPAGVMALDPITLDPLLAFLPFGPDFLAGIWVG